MARRGKLGGSVERFVKEKVREVAREALEVGARTTVRALQEAGPYWDGMFANAWVVRQGNVEIPAVVEGEIPGAEEPQRPKVFVDTPVPPADLRKGYSIGNEMVYRDVAMDLIPGRQGVYRGDRPGATAPRDWYTTLVKGGELGERIGSQLRQVSRRKRR